MSDDEILRLEEDIYQKLSSLGVADVLQRCYVYNVHHGESNRNNWKRNWLET